MADNSNSRSPSSHLEWLERQLFKRDGYIARCVSNKFRTRITQLQNLLQTAYQTIEDLESQLQYASSTNQFPESSGVFVSHSTLFRNTPPPITIILSVDPPASASSTFVDLPPNLARELAEIFEMAFSDISDSPPAHRTRSKLRNRATKRPKIKPTPTADPLTADGVDISIVKDKAAPDGASSNSEETDEKPIKTYRNKRRPRGNSPKKKPKKT